MGLVSQVSQDNNDLLDKLQVRAFQALRNSNLLDMACNQIERIDLGNIHERICQAVVLRIVDGIGIPLDKEIQCIQARMLCRYTLARESMSH